MPKFTVEHQTQHSKQETYEKIKGFLQKEDLTKMAPGAKLQFSDEKQEADLVGPQFKAQIKIQDQGSSSSVHVHVDLGFLLTPLRGKVEEILKKQLTKHLG